MNKDEFLNYFERLPEDYSIGIHGITGDSPNYLEVVNSILDNGLRLSKNGWGGLLSSIQMYGQKCNMTGYELNRLVNYFYGCVDNDDRIVNVIFGFPEVMNDLNGNTYFLGHYNQVAGYAKGHDKGGDNNPLTKMTEKEKCVSKEFIVGYYVGKYDTDNFEFFANPNFIGLKSKYEQDEFFESIKDRIDVEPIAEEIRGIKILESFGFKDNDFYEQTKAYYEEHFGGMSK